MELGFYLHGERYIYASLYCDDGRLKQTTGVKATKQEWESGKLPKASQRTLDRLKVVVNGYIDACKLLNDPIKKEAIENLILAETGKNKAPKSNKVGQSMHDFIEMAKSGAILNKGKRWGESSIALFSGVYGVIQAARLDNVTLNEFNLKHFETFKKAILAKERHFRSGEIQKGLSQNTLSLYITHLRTFFSRSRTQLNWHTNTTLDDKGLHVPQEDIDTKVYVSSSELTELYTREIENKYHRATLDAFIFGCNIGQRLSDAMQIKPICRTGNKLDLSTIKKGWRVVIPMSKVAIEIWDKYDGNIPFSSNFTERVQELFQHLKYDQPTLYSYTVGGVKDTRYWKKWELMSSHTMRRSFATNAYLAKIPIPAIMKITGHKSIKSFLEYICVGVEENADIMLEHEFFK